MPQPEEVEFEQPAQEKLITEEAELARAKAGPDIHCHYCGTRNPAGAESCTQCGAPLSEGTARASGKVLGAHRPEPAKKITCAACGTPNQADAARCVQCGAGLARPKPEPTSPKPAPVPTSKGRFGFIGLAILLLIAACITFVVLLTRTEDTTGKVKDVSWKREIAVEALVPVTYENWRGEIPADAVVGTCTQKVHHTQDDPAPNAEEVCGTPYTVDKGSGYAEVVQDCEYRVYVDWCEYSVEEWKEVDKASLSGNDFKPRWPKLQLTIGQREGKRSESYEIAFTTEGGTYTYQTGDANLFAQCEIGSRWVLKLNSFDTVTGLEPIR
jgi:ribosomal protein L40E